MQRNDILKLLFETPYEALRERADEVRRRKIFAKIGKADIGPVKIGKGLRKKNSHRRGDGCEKQAQTYYEKRAFQAVGVFDLFHRQALLSMITLSCGISI